MRRLKLEHVRAAVPVVLAAGVALMSLCPSGCQVTSEQAASSRPAETAASPDKGAVAPKGDAAEAAASHPASPEQVKKAILAFVAARAKAIESREAFMAYRASVGRAKSDQAFALTAGPTLKDQRLRFSRLFREAEEGFEEALRLDPRNPAALKEYGALLYDFNRPARAIPLWERALEIDPKDFVTAFSLAKLYEQTGDTDKALRAYEKSLGGRETLTRGRTIALVRMRLAQLYEEDARFTKALDQIEQLLRDYGEGNLASGVAQRMVEDRAPDLCESLAGLCGQTDQVQRGITFLEWLTAQTRILEADLALARLYVGAGQYEKAMALAAEYARQSPLERGGHALVVEIFRKTGRFDEGLTYCRQILAERPQSIVIPRLQARLFLDKGDVAEALAIYRELIEKQPRALRFYLEFADLCQENGLLEEEVRILGKALTNKLDLVDVLGRVDSLLNDDDLKEELLAVAGRIVSGEDGTKSFGVLYLAGEIFRREGKLDEAEQALHACFRENPAFLPAVIALADVHLEKEQYEQAVEILDEARSKGLSHSILYNTLAVCLGRLGEHERQIDVLQEGLRADPSDRSLRYNLALAYEMSGDRLKGAEELERLLKEHPDDGMIANALGYLYAEEGIKLDYAKELIHSALQDDPDNGAYVDSLGWVYYRRGEFEEALKHLERAADLEKGDPEILDHLGDAYFQMRQYDHARKAWEEALAGKRKTQEIEDSVRRKLSDLNALVEKGRDPERQEEGPDEETPKAAPPDENLSE